jgi:hypothetical protein
MKGEVSGGETTVTPCRRCGGAVVQKQIARLTIVGIAMIVPLGLAVLWPILWIPAIIIALTGTYLLVWATVGRGRWCRGCKRFDGV